MFNPRKLLIDTFISKLETSFYRLFGSQSQEYLDVTRSAVYLTLEKISRTDALYHNLDNTLACCCVGLEIVEGKRNSGLEATAKDWSQFMISVMCCNIGFLPDVCPGDTATEWIISEDGKTQTVPPGATGAICWKDRETRSAIAARHFFGHNKLLDIDEICAEIDYARFPVPDLEKYQETTSYRGLLRAATFIGAIADPNYMRKLNALYLELQEAGQDKVLGVSSVLEFRNQYLEIYRTALIPYIDDAVHYLSQTDDGNHWIANMNAHLHAETHHESAMGIARE